jgi:hypothetical protein
MARFQIRAAGAAVLALGLAQPLAAQSTGVLAEWYGAGVHAYFDNQLTEAHRALTAAIESGSQDPRAHYYRALTYLRLGRPEQAGADMARGADLEMRDTAGRYPVGRSLERVQGSERMLLERYRVQARTASYQRQQQIRQQRYEEVVRREADVLRRAVNVPLDELASPDVPPLPQPPQVSAQPPAESPEPPPEATTNAAAPGNAVPPDDSPEPQQRVPLDALGRVLGRVVVEAIPGAEGGAGGQGGAGAVPPGIPFGAGQPDEPFGAEPLSADDVFGNPPPPQPPAGAQPTEDPFGGGNPFTDDPVPPDAANPPPADPNQPAAPGGQPPPGGDAPEQPQEDPFPGFEPPADAGGNAPADAEENPQPPLDEDAFGNL